MGGVKMAIGLIIVMFWAFLILKEEIKNGE